LRRAGAPAAHERLLPSRTAGRSPAPGVAVRGSGTVTAPQKEATHVLPTLPRSAPRATTAALALGALLLVGAAAPAAADAADVPVSGEACPAGEGVTVVVDFPGRDEADPGEVVVGCAPEAG